MSNKLILKVDNREPQIIKETLKNLQVKNLNSIKFENLEQADFIIESISECNENSNAASNKLLFIVERKSISDLLSSVKDNRYSEQSVRLTLLKEQTKVPIYYIIEGNRNNLVKDSIDYKTFYSCIFSLSYKKGFNVLLSNSIEETILLLTEFISRLTKESNLVINENSNVSKSNELLIKKQTVTKENISALMLSCIPGIGLTTAESIISNYNNSILKLLSSDSKQLEDIKINNRKLSKKIISTIQEYLLN